MSDLAMPLLVLFDDDALAFWCFAALMRTFGARGNFAVDESGIFSQLRALSRALARADRVLAHKLQAMGAGECHFAYRMVVVLMRRDLPLSQVRGRARPQGGPSRLASPFSPCPRPPAPWPLNPPAACAQKPSPPPPPPPPKAMTLWELLWADARKQLLARHRRGLGPGPDAAYIPAAPDMSGGGPAAAAPPPGDADGDADFLSATAADLFVHFAAAVVIGARRRVLDECTDQDDAMRLFHTLKGVDFWECVTRAHVLRAAGAARKSR
jgi:hypothetical protein